MADPFDFNGKVALVTGGSRGIGAAIASALANSGAVCAINYVDDPKGSNLADAQRVAAALPKSRVFQADVSHDAQVAAMIDEIGRAMGGLDILVNNAGILSDKTIAKMTAQQWDAVLRVNLSGAFHCTQHGSRILRPGGRVVNMASVSAALGFFGQANYAASKAGLIALTKVTARELARQQITANAIAPGFIDTEMTRGMPPAVIQKSLEQIPLGRFGAVDDIAGVVLFLCSPLAKYITGQVIHVNGGFYMG